MRQEARQQAFAAQLTFSPKGVLGRCTQPQGKQDCSPDRKAAGSARRAPGREPYG